MRCRGRSAGSFGRPHRLLRRHRQRDGVGEQFRLQHRALGTGAELAVPQVGQLMQYGFEDGAVLALQVGDHAEQHVDIARESMDVDGAQCGHPRITRTA
jgi:hypothetical protein